MLHTHDRSVQHVVLSVRVSCWNSEFLEEFSVGPLQHSSEKIVSPEVTMERRHVGGSTVNTVFTEKHHKVRMYKY